MSAQRERTQEQAKRAAENYVQRQKPGFVAMSDTAFKNKGDWVVRVELQQDQHFRGDVSVRVPINAADNNIR